MFAFTPALTRSVMAHGIWSMCPNYPGLVACPKGRLVMAGNDSRSQFVEVTKRLPTDPASTRGAFARGS